MEGKQRLTCRKRKCRICRQAKEKEMHCLSGCTRLAATEYLERHNNALMILFVALRMQEELLVKNTKLYIERWDKGTVIENNECKYKNKNKLFLIDILCSGENNVDTKHAEKLQKYQQLAFEIRQRQPGHKVMIIPIVTGCSGVFRCVTGCLGGGLRRVINEIGRIISDDEKTRAISNEMVKTVLFESKSITRKVLSGLI